MIKIRNMMHKDIQDVCEAEVAYYCDTSKKIILPSALAWKERDYTEAISENNYLALVAEDDKTKKVVGVLVYRRPEDKEFFDIVRLVPNVFYEVDFDIRKKLLGHMVSFAREDISRTKIRVYTHGDDISSMEFISRVGWSFKRLKDKDDTYVWTDD